MVDLFVIIFNWITQLSSAFTQLQNCLSHKFSSLWWFPTVLLSLYVSNHSSAETTEIEVLEAVFWRNLYFVWFIFPTRLPPAGCTEQPASRSSSAVGRPAAPAYHNKGPARRPAHTAGPVGGTAISYLHAADGRRGRAGGIAGCRRRVPQSALAGAAAAAGGRRSAHMAGKIRQHPQRRRLRHGGVPPRPTPAFRAGALLVGEVLVLCVIAAGLHRLHPVSDLNLRWMRCSFCGCGRSLHNSKNGWNVLWHVSYISVQ